MIAMTLLQYYYLRRLKPSVGTLVYARRDRALVMGDGERTKKKKKINMPRFVNAGRGVRTRGGVGNTVCIGRLMHGRKLHQPRPRNPQDQEYIYL